MSWNVFNTPIFGALGRFAEQTDDVEEARRRRDRALALIEEAHDCKISLRFAPRRTAEARS